jgi:hypothetical protein
MADYYALTSKPLPKEVHCRNQEFSVRRMSQAERIAVEDYLFNQEIKLTLDPATTAVVVSQSLMIGATAEEFGVLMEFALGMLTISGFLPVDMVVTFGSSGRVEGLRRSIPSSGDQATFPEKLGRVASAAWMRRFFRARTNTKDRLHITADRYVRYSKGDGSRDSLVDLCICLESLLDATTEISFRFGACLTKVIGFTGAEAEQVCDLLSDLYNLRSKVVHGADASKEYKKIAEHIGRLHHIARRILTTYVLYLSERTREDWKKHTRSVLFV